MLVFLEFVHPADVFFGIALVAGVADAVQDAALKPGKCFFDEGDGGAEVFLAVQGGSAQGNFHFFRGVCPAAFPAAFDADEFLSETGILSPRA